MLGALILFILVGDAALVHVKYGAIFERAADGRWLGDIPECLGPAAEPIFFLAIERR